jgi:S1-C subfamily serine protease
MAVRSRWRPRQGPGGREKETNVRAAVVGSVLGLCLVWVFAQTTQPVVEEKPPASYRVTEAATMPTTATSASAPTTRPSWIGVERFEILTAANVELVKLDPNHAYVLLLDVFEGLPAAKAGLRDRDLVSAVNKQPIARQATDEQTIRAFGDKLGRTPVGEKATLTVMRLKEGKKTADYPVTAEPMPVLPTEARRCYAPYIGLAVRERVPLDELLEKGPTAGIRGLIVVGALGDSPAAKAGLVAGDLVLKVNGKDVLTVDDISGVLEEHVKKGPEADVVVERQKRAGAGPDKVIVRLKQGPATAPGKR